MGRLKKELGRGATAFQCALACWAQQEPSDAAEWQLRRAGAKRCAPPSPQLPHPIDGEVHLLVLVGLKVSQALVDWLSGHAQRSILLIYTDPMQVAEFLGDRAQIEILRHPRFRMRFWPVESLDQRWKWPAGALQHYVEGRSCWLGSDSEVLDRVEAVAKRACSILFEGVVRPQAPIVNVWQNLPLLSASIDYSGLADCARGCSVVIIGAGASARQTLSELRAIHGKALVFSGGAGLLACAKAGLVPDLACLIDPSDSQLLRAAPWCDQDLPLLTTLRCHAPTLHRWQGPLLFSPRPDEVPIGGLAEHWLGLNNPVLESGILDVGAMLASMALFMGASRIHFIGRDLRPAEDAGTGPGRPTAHWRAIAEHAEWLAQRYPNVCWSTNAERGYPQPSLRLISTGDWLGVTAGEPKSEHHYAAIRAKLRALPRAAICPEQVHHLKQSLYQSMEAIATQHALNDSVGPMAVAIVEALARVQALAVEEGSAGQMDGRTELAQQLLLHWQKPS